MNVSRVLFINVVLVAVVLGTGFLASCRHPDFHGGSYHHRHDKKGFPGFFFKRLDRHMEDLNLTEEQNRKYEEIKAMAKEDFKNGMEKREIFFEALEEEINQQDPDMNVIADLMKERIEAFPALINKHLDALVEFYNLLDEDQKAEVLEHFRDHLDWHH